MMKIDITYIYDKAIYSILDMTITIETKEKTYFIYDSISAYNLNDLKRQLKDKYKHYYNDDTMKMIFTLATIRGQEKITQKELCRILHHNN